MVRCVMCSVFMIILIKILNMIIFYRSVKDECILDPVFLINLLDLHDVMVIRKFRSISDVLIVMCHVISRFLKSNKITLCVFIFM